MRLKIPGGRIFFTGILSCFWVGCQPKQNQSDPLATILAGTTVLSSVPYDTTGPKPLLLDAYVPAKALGKDPWVVYSPDRKPTLLYLHGGGWSAGDRISRSLLFLPYLQQGWAVVSADYRLLGPTNLIDCIRDSRSALAWIYDHADDYRFDTTRIVLSGESAGAHLALMTGLAANHRLFTKDNRPPSRPLRVAAIVNWYGISDVEKAVAYWNSDAYTRQIIGDHPSSEELLRLTSPVRYITPEAPPILSVHGDSDVNVPIVQSELLHRQLDAQGVRNTFIRLPGKRHGNFSAEEVSMVFEEIWKFLEKK